MILSSYRAGVLFAAPIQETNEPMTTSILALGSCTSHRLRRLATTAVGAFLMMWLGVFASEAHAEAPVWKLTITSQPTHLVPGVADQQYVMTLTNIGSGDAAMPYAVTDTLPPGLVPVSAGISYNGNVPCAVVGQSVTCTSADLIDNGYPALLHPGQSRLVSISLDVVAPDHSVVTNHASVSGGGASSITATAQTTISSTPAAFGFLDGANGLSAEFTGLDGQPVTQAGSHPDMLTVDLGLADIDEGVANAGTTSTRFSGADGGPRDIATALPRGVVVDPSATPIRCTENQLESSSCPDASQVGTASVLTTVLGGNEFSAGVQNPLYNMVPPAGVPAEFGFDAVTGVGIFVHIAGGVRGSDYALTANANDIPAHFAQPIDGVQVQLWGDPSGQNHNFFRGIHCYGIGGGACPDPITSRTTPLLTMPTACQSSLPFDASADSWISPGTFVTRATVVTDSNDETTSVTGCSQLDFSPRIDLQPTTHQASAPSGMDVDLQVPQTDSLNTLAEAHLKKAVVTLPEGMSLNPSAAQGLEGCTETQIGLTVEGPPAQFDSNDPQCPNGSLVGTATLDTPLLPDPLAGQLYLAEPYANPFHTLLAGYLVVQGQGVTVKLAGRFDLDPVTGRVTATFDDNPQVPFSDLKLHFKSGDRGVLITPATCGAFATHSSLTSWASATAVELDSPLTVDGGCDQAGKFEPSFSAGTVSPTAAARTSFVLDLKRPAGQQRLAGLDVALPPGLLAEVGGVPLCPDAQAADGSCDGASRIGAVQVAAGAGSDPLWVPQAGKAPTAVYLAGPYKGAPYSLSVVVPAQAGPFDLGTVVVRAAIFVDPIDAHVTVKSDPLPTILQGVPLDTREVHVTLDRPDFTLNPTSCAPKQIGATITSEQGSSADVSSRFQVGECASLDLKPKLAIALTGKGQTTDDKHPGVHATVSQTAGQANLKKVVVTLPLSLALDPDNANGLCEFTDGSKVDPTCPKASIVGKAVARTPILNQPLTGPVYFVKNIRKDAKTGREIRTLPKLVIPLTGENGLRLNLVGTSNVVNNRLVNTFDNIPDAPVSDFTLDIDGGKSGILVVSGTDICKATQVADRQIDGQNGKTADANVYLQTPACALKILSKKVGKTSVAIKVGGLSAGKVTVTGHGIKKTTKTITKSTVATITAKRTKGKPGKVTVSFDPTGPAKAHKTTR